MFVSALTSKACPRRSTVRDAFSAGAFACSDISVRTARPVSFSCVARRSSAASPLATFSAVSGSSRWSLVAIVTYVALVSNASARRSTVRCARSSDACDICITGISPPRPSTACVCLAPSRRRAAASSSSFRRKPSAFAAHIARCEDDKSRRFKFSEITRATGSLPRKRSYGRRL